MDLEYVATHARSDLKNVLAVSTPRQNDAYGRCEVFRKPQSLTAWKSLITCSWKQRIWVFYKHMILGRHRSGEPAVCWRRLVELNLRSDVI
jgi:hypothetical protein